MDRLDALKDRIGKEVAACPCRHNFPRLACRFQRQEQRGHPRRSVSAMLWKPKCKGLIPVVEAFPSSPSDGEVRRRNFSSLSVRETSFLNRDLSHKLDFQVRQAASKEFSDLRGRFQSPLSAGQTAWLRGGEGL